MEFLNIGFGELLLIGIIALLVFGPERLPELARQAARLMGQLRRAADDVTRTFTEETRPVREPFQEARREIDALSQPLRDTKKEMEALTDPLKGVRDELNSLTRPPAKREESEATVTPPVEPNGTVVEREVVDAPPAPESGAQPVARSYKPVSRTEVSDGDER